MRKKKKIITIIAAILIVIIGGDVAYAKDYYRATDEISTYLQGSEDVTFTETGFGLFLDGEGTENALIFYPGAKVEYTSYIPMLYKFAEDGTDVFIVKMPCNLAFFGINTADDIIAAYDYDNWYLAGHSLGGAMIANYAAEKLEDGNTIIKGLLLLAAYPTKNLDYDDFSVLTLYGSEDKVVNLSNIESGRELMPQNSKEFVIEGGNHAQFGCYGAQKGDGEATVSAEEQWNITVKEAEEFFNIG